MAKVARHRDNTHLFLHEEQIARQRVKEATIRSLLCSLPRRQVYPRIIKKKKWPINCSRGCSSMAQHSGLDTYLYFAESHRQPLGPRCGEKKAWRSRVSYSSTEVPRYCFEKGQNTSIDDEQRVWTIFIRNIETYFRFVYDILYIMFRMLAAGKTYRVLSFLFSLLRVIVIKDKIVTYNVQLLNIISAWLY